MKNLLRTAILLAAIGCEVPNRTPKVYPLGVRIQTVTSQQHFFKRTFYGTGKGNIRQEDGKVNGFEFNYDCPVKLEPTDGPGFRTARWSSRPHDLVMIGTFIGTDRTVECPLKVTLTDWTYEYRDGQLVTIPAT